MTRHTPSPWFRAKNIGVDDCTVRAVDIGCTFGRIVADVIEPDDANLIAAAPDMLVALEAIWRRIDRTSGSPNFKSEEADELADLIIRAGGVA